ncbi:MAG: mercury methylation corrinoid protein HgcA [Pirellulales bacterium]
MKEKGCCGSKPALVSLAPSACCGQAPCHAAGESSASGASWTTGAVASPVGEIPRVATALRCEDRLGAWRMRWGIGRLRYKVEPGLYAVGNPTADSPVLVSANYKLSFDRLRAELARVDAWLLVLDTHGVNVWCAAGKGTFGTDELVRRIEATRLAEVVTHRTLIVPQLGAVGVAAHEVKHQSGFRVAYGPVRAEDLRAFLGAGMQATPEMRQMTFPLLDRVVLIPVEIVLSARWVLWVAACFAIVAGLGRDGYSLERLVAVGLPSAGLVLGVYLAAIVLTAALLPWLPGRAFATKGAWLGLAILSAAVGLGRLGWNPFDGWLNAWAWCLLILAASSFLAMNFTGATTFTSLSGVRREMRVAVPLQAACGVLGLVLWLIGRFV